MVFRLGQGRMGVVQQNHVTKGTDLDPAGVQSERLRTTSGSDLKQDPTTVPVTSTQHSTLFSDKSLNVFKPPKLFQQISSRIEVGSNGKRDLRIDHRGKVGDSVAEVRFGHRTEADLTARVGEVAQIFRSRMRAVDRHHIA